MKINWHGVAAATVSVLGVVSSPAVLNLLSPQAAACVSAAGLVYQAFTHAAATKQ